jgi:hypothetical protein
VSDWCRRKLPRNYASNLDESVAEYTDGTNGNSPVKLVQNAKKLKSMVLELKIDMELKF